MIHCCIWSSYCKLVETLVELTCTIELLCLYCFIKIVKSIWLARVSQELEPIIKQLVLVWSELHCIEKEPRPRQRVIWDRFTNGLEWLLTDWSIDEFSQINFPFKYSNLEHNTVDHRCFEPLILLTIIPIALQYLNLKLWNTASILFYCKIIGHFKTNRVFKLVFLNKATIICLEVHFITSFSWSVICHMWRSINRHVILHGTDRKVLKNTLVVGQSLVVDRSRHIIQRHLHLYFCISKSNLVEKVTLHIEWFAQEVLPV